MKHPIHIFINNLFFTFLSIIFIPVFIHSVFDIAFGRAQVMLLIMSAMNFIFISIASTTTLLLYFPKFKKSFLLTTVCFLFLPIIVFIVNFIFISTQDLWYENLTLLTIPISSFIFLCLQLLFYTKFIKYHNQTF